MSGFVLHLQETTRCERIAEVTAFVGEDDSGQFGIHPGHERFLTMHVFGMARFRVQDLPFEYLAVAGGLLYFVQGELFLCSRRLYRHRDYAEVLRVLTEQLAAEERALLDLKKSLRHLEDEMLKRLWRLGPSGLAG